MNRHPGGEAYSRELIRRSGLSTGMSILDMGAGAGETVALLRSMGYQALGIDIHPGGSLVEAGDYLKPLPWEAFFDGVISQCSFYCSNDPERAIQEAYRVLKKNGIMILSDICPLDRDLGKMVEAAGFRVLYREDQTEQWKQYYMQALWQGRISPIQTGKKYRYETILCEKT